MRHVPIALLLTLAACNRAEPAPEPSAPVAHARPVTPGASPPAKPGATPTVAPGMSLPPVSATPRYVGRWAANAALCADGAWDFAPRKLTTAGEVSCDFDTIKLTPSGYDIAARCTAQAPARPARLVLTFAESAKAMMVEGGPFQGPIGLIWCGPPASP